MEQTPQGQRPARRSGRRSFLITAGGLCLSAALAGCASTNGNVASNDPVRARVQAETFPKVSVSCGVSDWSFEDEKISVESLFYRADMALYRAKHSGKNRICAD